MNAIDQQAYCQIVEYYHKNDKYPSQIEVSPELFVEMTVEKFNFYLYDKEPTPCVFMHTHDPVTQDCGCQIVSVPVIVHDVNPPDPIVYFKPFSIIRSHHHARLAKQQAKLAFQQWKRGMQQRGLKVHVLDEEGWQDGYLYPVCYYSIFGLVRGSFDDISRMEGTFAS